ncbi:hypothetical protein L484_000786 [Morus notabilis]|uniref:Uncharacterized protein n=1 Tax=Morus notabilis TaxID=981085 RepID=W9SFF3_9ROSA|nr:hypothetical protein L484_000786 [Morus notabilis]
MGRRIPTNDIVLIHPLLSFTLLAAGMAATIAILSGLCGVRHRRKSSPPPPLPTPKKKEAVSSPPTTTITSTTTTKKPPSAELTEHRNELLPAPPAKKKLVREAYSCKDMTKFMSERKIAASLSMRVTRSLSMVRNRDQVKEETSKKGKLKTEDSIWMKTIILGEKCRVPNEEEEGVIYQGQGRRISAYHPRTASSLSISRQCSFIDQEAVPRHELRK